MTTPPEKPSKRSDDRPRKVYLEITTDCNLACAMCIRHSWQQPARKMSADTFGKFLRQVRDLPTLRTINFSGYGEPMTHPLFWDFLGRAKRAGLCVEFVTNGLLLDASAADRLIDLGVDRLIVSLDGVSDDSSRSLHSGSFAAVAEGLAALHRRRMMRGVQHPEVCIEFVATRRNIHELPDLKARSRVLGFSSILVTNLVPHTPELAGEILYGRWSTAPRGSPSTPWNPVVDLPVLDTRTPAGEAIERLRDAGTHLRVAGFDVQGGGPRCPFVTQGRFAVLADGRVSPCLPLLHNHVYYFRGKARRVFECHMGNLRRTPLAEIWNGPAYRSLRRRVRKFEFSPCIDCGSCDLRDTNLQDCSGDTFPRCGECLWAAGLVQCP